MGNLQAGFKYRFVQEGERVPQIAVYPQIQAPTERGSPGPGNGHWRLYLPILFQKSFGPRTTFGGPGLWRNPGEGNQNYASFGWQVQRNFGAALSIGAEVFCQGADRVDTRSSATFNLGFIYALGPRFAVLGSIGRGFRGETGHQLYLGVRGNF